MRRSGFLLLACCTLALAQDPVYEFTGAPLSIPYTCSDEDIDWAGLTCTDEPCPIYTEMTHAAGLGKSILITGNFHSATATMYSLLLRGDDGGRTWREPFARIRGAELDEVQVYDAQNAWIGGQMQQPLAMDPFFLVTSDGGASWTRVALLEEGTPGSILQFVFDSRTHGLATVDRGGGELRYESYETETGGTSWTMREKSGKLITLKSRPDSAWRMSPEKSLFRLEHLEDGRWSPFASFAIKAAECRTKPAVQREDPGAETKDDAVNEIQLGKPPKP